MESLRSHFHLIAYAVGFLGSVLVAGGGVRVVRAPALVARRRAPSDERERYARGLTDFYRISGALTLLAGMLLLLIAFVAW